jgi:hypothetical protein
LLVDVGLDLAILDVLFAILYGNLALAQPNLIAPLLAFERGIAVVARVI